MSISSLFWDQLAEKSWASCDYPQLLGESSELFFSELRTLAMSQTPDLRPARIGSGSRAQEHQEIRSDRIQWQDFPPESKIYAALNDLKLELNRHFYLGLQQWECHFSHYAPGSHYDWHRDQGTASSTSPTPSSFANKEAQLKRAITFIFYLNPNWQDGHGGELEIEGEPALSPLAGRLVLFRSSMIRHRVRITNADRWSLTGWFLQSSL
jgi:SM-20-related protein